MLLKKFPLSDDKNMKKTLDEVFDKVQNEDDGNGFWDDLLKRKQQEL
jgi:hypothetical protein|tara:strand:+ start:388 stop:528 length:141 start_codon:yes stop_codon:yes gene_type:complete